MYPITEPYKLKDWAYEKVKLIDKNCYMSLILNPRAINMLEYELDATINNKSIDLYLFKKSLNMQYLSLTSSVYILDFLEKNPHYIDWFNLSRNPSSRAILILKRNMDKIKWKNIVMNKNPEVLNIIKENIDKIDDWSYLSMREDAYEILKENRDKIVWYYFCKNKNPKMIEILEDLNEEELKEICWLSWMNLCANENESIMSFIEKHINHENIDWENLSANKCACKILKKYPNEINWNSISNNRSYEAIEIIKENLDKIDWKILSGNPFAYEILKENPDKVNFKYFTSNKNAIKMVQEKIIEIIEKNQENNQEKNIINDSSISISLSHNKGKFDSQFLEKYKDNINCFNHWFHREEIFEYDYKEMKKRRTLIKKDLIVSNLKNNKKFSRLLD